MAAIERKTKRYPTDLTDAEWARVAPLLPKPAKRGRKPNVDLREVLNAIRYMTRSGGGHARAALVRRAREQGIERGQAPRCALVFAALGVDLLQAQLVGVEPVEPTPGDGQALGERRLARRAPAQVLEVEGGDAEGGCHSISTYLTPRKRSAENPETQRDEIADGHKGGGDQ